MWIRYDPDSDILTIRLDPAETQFRNESYADDTFEVIFDVDGDDRIAGIDILDASKRVNLSALLPVTGEARTARAG